MADIIYSKLQKGAIFSIHRVELKNDNDALCGVVVYVRLGQEPDSRDELDETILMAMQSQYHNSVDNPKYFTKDSLTEQDIEELCEIDIHKTNIAMHIDIKAEISDDISGWKNECISQLSISLIAYDVQLNFTTAHASIFSDLSLSEHGKLETEIGENLFIYQDFLH